MQRRDGPVGTLGAIAPAAPVRADAASLAPIVSTRDGQVRGALEDGVLVFKGLPFAAPPVGANRVQPPAPARPWTGVRDALAFGPKPPQAGYPPGIAEFLPELVGQGDDCLTLNVWAPADGGGGHPVMVFVPGGMFEFHATGAAAYYDGSRFARDGVVLVSINYRVGADGFLFLGDGIANLGLLDQIAALQWVRDNIGAFGGDRGAVTLFGESAGGMSVATLMAVPRAAGLFRRAIVESGNTPIVNSAETAGRMARLLAARLGIEPDRNAFARTPLQAVLDAQEGMREDLVRNPDPAVWGEVAQTSLPWAPAADGDLLPRRPIDAIRSGAGADIPLVVGSNTEETRLFLLSVGALDGISDTELAAMAAARGLPEEGLRAYRAEQPGAGAGDVFSAIQTDWYWRLPAARLADARAEGERAPTFMYEFAWRSPLLSGRLGAAHGVELPFVFDTLDRGGDVFAGSDAPQSLATAMHDAWVAFAKTGDPGWPRYVPPQRTTMRFDASSAVLDDPLAERRARWGG